MRQVSKGSKEEFREEWKGESYLILGSWKETLAVNY
jgi:hypothetical protein